MLSLLGIGPRSTPSEKETKKIRKKIEEMGFSLEAIGFVNSEIQKNKILSDDEKNGLRKELAQAVEVRIDSHISRGLRSTRVSLHSYGEVVLSIIEAIDLPIEKKDNYKRRLAELEKYIISTYIANEQYIEMAIPQINIKIGTSSVLSDDGRKALRKELGKKYEAILRGKILKYKDFINPAKYINGDQNLYFEIKDSDILSDEQKNELIELMQTLGFAVKNAKGGTTNSSGGSKGNNKITNSGGPSNTNGGGINNQNTTSGQGGTTNPNSGGSNDSTNQNSGVDLMDLLNGTPTTSQTNQVDSSVATTRMTITNLVDGVKVTFSDNDIQTEVNKFLFSFLGNNKLDFFQNELSDFIKLLIGYISILQKQKNYRENEDYNKLVALKVFFTHVKKIYEYLALTIFDLVKSKDKSTFDKKLVLNTIQRKLDPDIVDTSFQDLNDTFSSLKTQISGSIDDIIDNVFQSINNPAEVFNSLKTSYPNLLSISEISRVINNENIDSKPNIEGKDYIINGVDFSDPKCIVEYLDIYATGQEHAKEVLAVAFSRFVSQGIVTSQLIVGPSGSGKTYMTDLLCKLTGFKFVNIGMANLSGAGIKGNNLKELLEPLKGHKGKAILFLDELDKLADSNNHNGQALQNELLTLFNTDSPSEEYAGIDLKSIMIIGAGAFEDNGSGKSLYSILKKKAGNNPDVFQFLDDSDLIDYGLKPEIVGRLNGKTYLNALSVDQLFEMMKKKGSAVDKLIKEMQESHIEIIFTDEALLEIAKAAHKGVGARAIKSILEKIMKPISTNKVQLAGKTITIDKKEVEAVLLSSNSAEKDIDWNDTKSIIAYLDRFVPGNENAKRALANSFREFMVYGELSHTFIYGESGAGKTYMISLLCKAAGIQMGEASLANVVSEGYKGTSLGDVIRGSFSKGYMGKSPKKVLFLDEIDKLINRSGGAFGNDLVNELLSIFNGTSEAGIDLSNCLIISAGACAGNVEGKSLKQLVQERLGGSNKIDDKSLLEQVEKEDLEAYGFKTELVGRFKRVSFLEPVTKDYLRKVMFESEGSVYKKKLEEAQLAGYDLNFTDEAIDIILEEAASMQTGVRGLETVLNRLFDKIYEDFGKIEDSMNSVVGGLSGISLMTGKEVKNILNEMYVLFSTGEINIEGDYAKEVLSPKVKFEHPDMDKIDWTSPQTIKSYLDTKASGNELYKKNLSLLFWKLKRKKEGIFKGKIDNTLVLGPSGGGKTYLLKLIAPLLGIPFAEANIATIESDYPKSKIGDVFDKIGKTVKVAIIFLDEIDKILMNPKHPLNNELMSYIEGGTYEGRDISNFVFVGAGAFQGHNVTDDDGNVNLQILQSIGVKSEVLGRWGMITGVEKMDMEKMMAILTSDNSVFNKRIESIKDDYDIPVFLEEGVLEYIAGVAIKQPTGARALDLITNTLFNGIEFSIGKYIEVGEIRLDLDKVKVALSNLDY